MSEQEDMTRSVSTLEAVTSAYSSVHGVLSLVVCAFGIPMNVLNITILTRKNMRTPVNCILMWLAIFDLLTMISYVPFSLHFYCLTWTMSAERNSLRWMTFLIFHVDFTSSTHTISVWLGVTLAMFRYKHIFSPAKGHLTRVRRLVRARLAVLAVIVLSVVVMVPNYLMNRLKPYPYIDSETNVTYIVFVTDPVNLGTAEIKPLAQATLVLHGTVAKFLPCILMVVYGGLLVKTLRTNIRMVSQHTPGRILDTPLTARDTSFVRENEDTDVSNQPHGSRSCLGFVKAHADDDDQISTTGTTEVVCLKCDNHLLAGTSSSATMIYLLKPSTFHPSTKRCSPATPLNGNRNGHLKRHHDNCRTTLMLLVVITLFLVTELPQAVLIVLSATIPGFFLGVYVPLGDVMDMVALVNNGINFLLYCGMSRDFRTTLLDMMKTFLDWVGKMPVNLGTMFEPRRRRDGDHQEMGTMFEPRRRRDGDHQEMSHVTLIVRDRNCSL